MFENFFAKIAGKLAARKLDLKETTEMNETKPWYQSKGVWTGVVTGVLGIYISVAPGLHLPVVPEWIFALLGGLGIYTRVSADTKIG